MPFIGKDWRSPGEAWVKTDEGSWEKLKILETSALLMRGRGQPSTSPIPHDRSGFNSSGESSDGDCSDTDSPSSPIADAQSTSMSTSITAESNKENKNPDDGNRFFPSQKSQSQMCPTPNTQQTHDVLTNRQSVSESQQQIISHQHPTCPGILSVSPSTNQPSIWPPHCQITLKSTKEVAGYNTISEAFHRLDFCSAISDIRRFNYVTKLLHLLINQSLTTLSGCATKALFSMLEQLAWQVASNQQNVHVLHQLLDDLKKMLANYYCWGRPLGSTILWEQHLATLEKLCQQAASIEIKGPPPTEVEGGRSLSDLPEELIREILLRLSDYKDLVNSAQANTVMSSLIMDEQHIWRELCRYHFSKMQIRSAIQAMSERMTAPTAGEEVQKQPPIDWEQVFQVLRKKYGLKEEYADTLLLCRYCRCLFWKSFGHPCVNHGQAADSSPTSTSPIEAPPSLNLNNNNVNNPLHVPVPPQAFLKFFSL